MARPAHFALATSPEDRAYLLRIAERDDARLLATRYGAALADAIARQFPAPSIESLRRQVAAYEAQAARAQLVLDAIDARMKEAA